MWTAGHVTSLDSEFRPFSACAIESMVNCTYIRTNWREIVSLKSECVVLPIEQCYGCKLRWGGHTTCTRM